MLNAMRQGAALSSYNSRVTRIAGIVILGLSPWMIFGSAPRRGHPDNLVR